MKRTITLTFSLDADGVEHDRYADVFRAVWMVAEAAGLGPGHTVWKDERASKQSLTDRWAFYGQQSRWE